MKHLTLDTALQRCSVAIADGGALLGDRQIELAGGGHAEFLAPLVAEALDKAEISVMALDEVRVTVGPGSFTGVRTGLAFARGLVIGTDIPCRGIDTLSALAVSRLAGGPVREPWLASVIDARRGEVYAGLYATHSSGPPRQVFGPAIGTPADIAQALQQYSASQTIRLIGSGAGLMAVASPDANWIIDPLTRIDSARLATAPQTAAFLRAPEPVYLRAPDAKPSATPDPRRTVLVTDHDRI